MRVLTLSQAAERINTPEPTLRKWLADGIAPRSYKVGRRRFFTEEAIDAWIRERMAESA